MMMNDTSYGQYTLLKLCDSVLLTQAMQKGQTKGEGEQCWLE